MKMDELTLTYVFRAIELLVLALGGLIWWQVRRADTLLEKLAGDVMNIREQQIRVDTLVGVMQQEVAGLRMNMERIPVRISELENKVYSLGKGNAGNNHRS